MATLFFFHGFFFLLLNSPLRRQFRSDPPLLWPGAAEPFHARQCVNKGG